MRTWYVAYRKGRDIAMQVTEDREAAITTACALLNWGIDVTEVGPTVGSSGRLDAMALREIYYNRATAGSVKRANAPGASAEAAD